MSQHTLHMTYARRHLASAPRARWCGGVLWLLALCSVAALLGCPNTSGGNDGGAADRAETRVKDAVEAPEASAEDVIDVADVRDAGFDADVRDAADVRDVRDVLDVLDVPRRDVPPRDVPPFVPFDALSADVSDAGGSVAPPRLIGPLHAMRVTSQRPTLRWELPAGATGARVELCRDRACSRALGAFDATGTSGRPPTALPAGVAFWRTRAITPGGVGVRTSATWEFSVGWRSAPVDTAFGAMKDFNGDGFDDLVVSAADESPGTVYVYHGAHGGVQTRPAARLASTRRASQYGTALDSAGDVNGDGYADLLVGTRASDDPALLYYGSASGLISPATEIFPTMNDGWAVNATGDLNGDGFSDITLTSARGNFYVYHGSATGVTQATEPMNGPFESSGVGDVNGDGYGDVLVAGAFGAPYFAQVLLGGPTPLTRTRNIPISPRTDGMTAFFYNGWVGSAGDMNGDRLGDMVVSPYGASRWALGAAVEGSYQFGGIWRTSITDARPKFPSLSFGTLGTAADFNGDGYSDVPIGFLGGNVVEVFFGGASEPDIVPSVVLRMAVIEARPRRGWACGGVGDLDGDGYDDLAVGEGDIQTTRLGQVLIFYGGETLSRTPGDVLFEPVAFGAFGLFRLASARSFSQRFINEVREPWLKSARNIASSM